MKITIRGYRGARWPGRGPSWRYRASAPCGWSYDAPAEYFDKIRASIEEHRAGCRRCP